MNETPRPDTAVEARHAARAAASGALPCEDWDVLFMAVLGRLHPAGGGVLPVLGQAEVDECVQALQQLQRAVQQERGLRLRLQRELRHTHAELAQLRQVLTAEVHGVARCDMAALELPVHRTAA